MATDPQRSVQGTMPFVPSYGANVIPAGQVVLGASLQPYAGQPLSLPQQNPQGGGGLQKMLKRETKTLGAIQIMIGLMHVGFGAVSLYVGGYTPLASIGGYPFWGGIFFIISGSLAVAVEHQLNNLLMKSSVGLNITSAVMAFIGVLLYLSELIINSAYTYSNSAGFGLAVLLLFFSLLEFCITVSTAHFGCQVTCPNCACTCCNNDPAMVFVPYTVSTGVVGVEENPAPPGYEDISRK